jgi:hypothetical protein
LPPLVIAFTHIINNLSFKVLWPAFFIGNRSILARNKNEGMHGYQQSLCTHIHWIHSLFCCPLQPLISCWNQKMGWLFHIYSSWLSDIFLISLREIKTCFAIIPMQKGWFQANITHCLWTSYISRWDTLQIYLFWKTEAGATFFWAKIRLSPGLPQQLGSDDSEDCSILPQMSYSPPLALQSSTLSIHVRTCFHSLALTPSLDSLFDLIPF